MSDIKVSVLTPLYNHAGEYVRKCLESLHTQTLQEIEFILIDNGANEENKALIAEYLKKDSRFRVLRFEENQGYGKAMNAGLASALGDYIGIVESDDFVESVMYQELYDIAKSSQVNFVKCLFRTVSNDKKDINSYPKINKHNCIVKNIEVPEIILDYHISQWAALYKTSFLRNNNIKWSTEKGASAQDISFVLKVFCLTDTLFILARTFYNYRLDNSNSSIQATDSNAWGCLKEYKLLIAWLKKKRLSDELWCIVYRRAYLNQIMSYKNRITKNGIFFILQVSKLFAQKKITFKFFKKNEIKSFLDIKNHPIKYWINSKQINFYNNLFIFRNNQQGEYKLKLIGLPIIHKKDTAEKKFIKILNIPLYYQKNSQFEIKRQLTLLQMQLSEINKNFAEIKNENHFIDKKLSNMKCIVEAQSLHPKTFGKYKNAFAGRDVVLVCTGPTAKNYKPIKDAIHVGVNGAVYLNEIQLDYLFVQDYTIKQANNKELNKDCLNYKGNNCQKFFGILPDERLAAVKHVIERIPLSYSYDNNVAQYIIEDMGKHNIAYDLSRHPIGDFCGTAFSALQFILYAHPTRLYLVGWDCSAGYAYNKPNAIRPANEQAEILKKYFVPFINLNYPDIEIISINPVGLKGVFKDMTM